MKERRLLLLLVLVVALGSAAEANFFTDTFDKLKSTFGNWADIIKEKFADLKESWSEKYGELTDKLKSMLDKNDFSNTTAAELLQDVPEKGWKDLQPRMLMSMKEEAAVELINDKTGKVPKRLQAEFNRLLLANKTDTVVLDEAKTKLLKMNLVEAETLLARLGMQDQWTKDMIQTLDLAALTLPVCMDRVTNAESRERLLVIIAKCEVTSPPSGCPSREIVGGLKNLIEVQKYGPASTITKEKVETWGGIDKIPKSLTNFIPTEMVKEFKSAIKQMSFDVDFTTNNENWKRRICEVENCKTLTKDTVKDWYDNMGGLKSRITPSDIPEAAMQNTEVSTAIISNAEEEKSDMRPGDARRIMKKKLGDFNKDATTVDQGNINDIGGHVLARGPTCFLKTTGDKNLLGGILTASSASIKGMKGPEYMSKTRTLTEACMNEAMPDGGAFTHTKVEENFKPFITAKLLQDQKKDILIQITQSAERNNDMMTLRKIEAVHSKVSAQEAIEFPTFIRDYLTVSAIESSSINDLTQLSIDMDPFALPCVKGAEMAWGGMTTVTVSDITANIGLLQCMSANQANKVPSNVIFDVFDVIKNKGILSPEACRVFAKKVEDWYKEISGDDDADKQEVWENIYLGELEKIPPCVYAEFGALNLDLLGRPGRTVVLRRLCAAKNYHTITPLVRRRIVNDLLERRIGEGQVTPCDLDILGQCAFDINANLLKNMNEVAKVNYIMKLQELMKMGSPGGTWVDYGCQDAATRGQVGVILTQVKGEPSTWKTAEDVSCLLDTLQPYQRDAIPPEVFTSVSCPRGMSPFSTVIPTECKDYYKKANMEIMKQQASKCINLRKEDGYNSACDKISCNGILVLSSSELSQLPIDDVYGNLEDLALPDITVEQAKVLMAKVTEKKKLEDLTNDDLGRIGSLYKAMTAKNVEDLPDFTPANSMDAVHAIGRLKDIPKDIATKLKEKILAEYKKPADLSSEDLMMLGNLVCVFTKDELNKVPNDVFSSAMRYLDTVDCGSLIDTRPIIEKAKAAYEKKDMPMNKWDAATMSEMNLLLKGMNPEEVMTIPETAFAGITPMGISVLSPQTIKAIKLDQLSNLTRSAVRSFTPQQKAQMSPEMLKILAKTDPLPSAPFKSGAESAYGVSTRWVAVLTFAGAFLVL
ncbi:hypothetical protein Pmani_040253 [Petrolisthes manimaculis]|uniref:Uncharacterized protein n=1 Tax=Petrolisthes manimaculis TaxID=1843537 RepID=A0AAE1TIU0_9EUCA|nr:hypothetical protein Pmani_040253 [Petrolisthes manimaculis]